MYYGQVRAATALARRPYDLRHAALSLWLNATGAPAQIAARAGNSTRVLHEVYLHCISGHNDLVSQQIENALAEGSGIMDMSPSVPASGFAHRLLRPGPCRYLSVNRSPVPRIAHARQGEQIHVTRCRHQLSPEFPQLKRHLTRFQPMSSDGAAEALADDPAPPGALVRGAYRRLRVGPLPGAVRGRRDLITIVRIDRVLSRRPPIRAADRRPPPAQRSRGGTSDLRASPRQHTVYAAVRLARRDRMPMKGGHATGRQPAMYPLVYRASTFYAPVPVR